MNQKQFIESKIELFNKEFTNKELWGDEEMEFTNEGNPDELRAFLSTALKEIVEEHFKEIIGEPSSHNRNCPVVSYSPHDKCTCGYEDWTECRDQITSRHNKFLS